LASPTSKNGPDTGLNPEKLRDYIGLSAFRPCLKTNLKNKQVNGFNWHQLALSLAETGLVHSIKGATHQASAQLRLYSKANALTTAKKP